MEEATNRNRRTRKAPGEQTPPTPATIANRKNRKRTTPAAVTPTATRTTARATTADANAEAVATPELTSPEKTPLEETAERVQPVKAPERGHRAKAPTRASRRAASQPSARAASDAPAPKKPTAKRAAAKKMDPLEQEKSEPGVHEAIRREPDPAPEAPATDPVATEPITPELATPESSTSEPATQEPSTPELASPQPAGPQLAAPNSHAAGFVTPQSAPTGDEASTNEVSTNEASTNETSAPQSQPRQEPITQVQQTHGQIHDGTVTATTAASAPDTQSNQLPARQLELASERRAPLWARLLVDPGYAPEHIAREAVRLLGPQARDWVEHMRHRYPDATPDGLARLAAVEHARIARRQGGLGGAGHLESLVTMGILARTEAHLVLTIAAAYGLDPTAEERGQDLLRLLRIPRLTQPSGRALANFARLVAGHATRRLAARFIPLGGAVAGAIQGSRRVHDLASRAVHYYRQRAAA